MIELPPPERRIFCNRTLNLRSIKAVGFDMDYTLIHYHTVEWEKRAYLGVQKRLIDDGFPVKHLQFDPRLIKLGLIIDTELGNIVKANRFGFIKRACHGTRPLTFDEQRTIYSRVQVNLAEPRWQFMNTLFALSEACIYSQMVDLLDQGKLGAQLGYTDLYKIVRSRIDETHMEGSLKSEIIRQPHLFVELDPEVPLALLDLKHAGKKLLLITNSEWHYTTAMMQYAFDRFLPDGMTWRDLFEIVIVEARKPDFFSVQKSVFEVADEEKGLLRPFIGRLRSKGVYLGGCASLIEQGLELSGEEILYIGDHIYADVLVSKDILRWRTALVVRELEQDLHSAKEFQAKQQVLHTLMAQKELLEHEYSLMRLDMQRLQQGYGPQPTRKANDIRKAIQAVREKVIALDERIAPLAKEASELTSPIWGPIMRAGNDKSLLARQIERYADIYTSRLSNFMAQTPFVYLRAAGGALPHD